MNSNRLCVIVPHIDNSFVKRTSYNSSTTIYIIFRSTWNLGGLTGTAGLDFDGRVKNGLDIAGSDNDGRHRRGEHGKTGQ